MNEQFKNILSPMTIGKVTFKNRMCVAPMGAGYGNRLGPHGEYTWNAIESMTERARGGFGLYFAGSIYPDTEVDPQDSYANFMNHSVDFMKRARVMIEESSYYGMKMIQQISAGVGKNDGNNYSSSRNEYFMRPGEYAPALTVDQIHKKTDAMVRAAKLMKNCGFVGVDIHAMHWGYLLDQFAMSLVNHRTDEYGGSLENRLRFAKEIVEGIKAECGSEFLVGMRMGLKSFMKDEKNSDFTGKHEAGRTLEESVEIAKLLEQYGYDYLNVDIGTYESFYMACPPIYIPDGVVIPYADVVKKAVNIPVLCGTRMGDPYVTDQAIEDGKIDAAVLGRPALADPHYVKKLETGRPEKIRPCIGCLVGCMGKLRSGQYMGCAVNPTVLRERDYTVRKAPVFKKVAVIGGGVAGMEAARIAKMRGHDVEIYEKSDRLGGLLWAAGAHDFKKEIGQLRDWYISEIRDLNIPVHFGKAMDEKSIKKLGADAVVLATGSVPIMPRISGTDSKKCTTGVDALLGKTKIGDKIVIVGGGLVGCETAVDYAKQGKDVTLVEAVDHVLGNSNMIPLMVSQVIPELLNFYGVKVKTGWKIQAVNDEGAVIVPSDGGAEEVIKADQVIMSIGMKSIKLDENALMGEGFEIFTIGDAEKVGNVYTCINGAYEIARRI